MNLKVYAIRSNSYLAIANMAMLLYVALVNFKESHDIHFTGWIVIPLAAFMVLLFLFLGWLEVKLGMFGEEQKITANTNPVILDILAKLDKIEDKLTENEKRDRKNKI